MAWSLCRQHAADGYQVYATCHKLAGADRLQALQANAPDKIEIIEMDVTNAAQVKAVAERLKGKPLDLLINNAGSVERVFYGSGAYEGKDDPDLRNYDFDGWLDLLAERICWGRRACAAPSSIILPPASARSPSTWGPRCHRSVPTWQAGRYAYRTSKAALNMLTRSAGEWYQKRGIILVSISPGSGCRKFETGGLKATTSPIRIVVKGLRQKVIAGLTNAHAGKFFNFNGQIFPW